MHIQELKKKKKKLIVINRNKFFIDYANNFAFNIKLRTRLGEGLKGNELAPEKLAVLSKSYVRARRTYLKSILYDKRLISKSCLTLTGEMLNSIQKKTTIYNNNVRISLYFTGFNAKKAQWANDGSDKRPERPFFYFSDIQVMAFKRDFETLIREIIP